MRTETVSKSQIQSIIGLISQVAEDSESSIEANDWRYHLRNSMHLLI